MVIGAPLSDLVTIEAANILEVIGAPLSDLVTIEAVNNWGKLFLSPWLFILDIYICEWICFSSCAMKFKVTNETSPKGTFTNSYQRIHNRLDMKNKNSDKL